MCSPKIEKFGATPTNVQWTVVRGDTALLEVQFLNNDEVTFFDTSDWTYAATAYDTSGDVLDALNVVINEGYVTIKAPASITSNWGTRYNSVVSELRFDLQVTIPADGEDTIWTPVIGTICVLGDVSPGSTL
jgi:hypothetical protein